MERRMRLTALFSPIAFALLAAALACLGFIPWPEAILASISVALIFVPSGWWAATVVRRRMAEATLVPAAFAMTMVSGATMRHMVLPPLLLLAIWTAAAAAWDRVPNHRLPAFAALLGLAARAAVAVGQDKPVWEGCGRGLSKGGHDSVLIGRNEKGLQLFHEILARQTGFDGLRYR